MTRDDGLFLDSQVFVVIYTAEDVGDCFMTTFYRTEAEARTHWRFKTAWGEPERCRIEMMTYQEYTTKAYGNMANPFQAVAELEEAERVMWRTVARDAQAEQ